MLNTIPSTKQEILAATAPVTVEITADSRYAKLVAEKQLAGLSREQAEQVAVAQITRDREVELMEVRRKAAVMPTSSDVIEASRLLGLKQRPLTVGEQERKADANEAGLAESGLNSNAAQVPQNDNPKTPPVKVESKDTKTAKA